MTSAGVAAAFPVDHLVADGSFDAPSRGVFRNSLERMKVVRGIQIPRTVYPDQEVLKRNFSSGRGFSGSPQAHQQRHTQERSLDGLRPAMKAGDLAAGPVLLRN